MKHSVTSFSAWAISAMCACSPLVSLAQSTPAATPSAPVTVGDVRVIGSQTVPNDLMVDNTLVGGLSGIDYDAVDNSFVIVSDDRSDQQPARFYEAEIPISGNAIGPVKIDRTVTLLQANGEPYPNAEAGGNVPDPESVRIDPCSGNLFYTSEGSQKLLIDPFMAVAGTDGQYIAGPKTPDIFHMSADKLTGPRDNLVFEGLSFSADGTSLWLAMEGPLYQDGPTATADRGATSRITNVDRAGNVLGQFAYELDPIPGPTGAGYFGTGVTEILAIDDTRFLTIERASVEGDDGVFRNFIKVYEIDTAGATDIKSQQWLTTGGYTPVGKRLVLDLNGTDVTPIDNVEGITWGPKLENGNPTLILVSDNNFSETQVTQFIALEVAS